METTPPPDDPPRSPDRHRPIGPALVSIVAIVVTLTLLVIGWLALDVVVDVLSRVVQR